MFENTADLVAGQKITCNFHKSVLIFEHFLKFNSVTTSVHTFTLHLSSIILHALNRTSVS